MKSISTVLGLIFGTLLYLAFATYVRHQETITRLNHIDSLLSQKDHTISCDTLHAPVWLKHKNGNVTLIGTQQ